MTRGLSRRVLPLGVLAAVALAVGLAPLFRWHAQRTKRARELVEASLSLRPLEMLAASDRALELAPGLARAHALRGLALAWLGKLGEADDELALGGTDDLATRARAWVLFRRGERGESGLMLVRFGADVTRMHEAECFPEGFEWLIEIGHGGRDRKPQPYFGTRSLPLTPTRAKLQEGTLEACAEALLEARVHVLALEDAAADALVAKVERGCPREGAWAAAAREDFERIRTNRPLEHERWACDRELVAAAVADSERRLERHRLLGDESELRHATAVLRRAAILDRGDLDLDPHIALSRALARRLPGSHDELALLTRRLEAESVIVALERQSRTLVEPGDSTTAAAVVAPAFPPPGVHVLFPPFSPDLRAGLGPDGLAVARVFVGEESATAEERDTATRAVRALLLDDLPAARPELEWLAKGHVLLGVWLAEARLRDDPVGSLETLARSWTHWTRPLQESVGQQWSQDVALVRDRLPSPGELRRELAKRGLTTDEVERGVWLAGLEDPTAASAMIPK